MRSVFLILALFASSCQWSEDRFAKRAVSRDELVGTWVVTDYGLKSLKDVGVVAHLAREDHVVVLRQDTTCAIRTTFGLPQPATYRSYDQGCSWDLSTWEDAHRHRQTLRLTLPGQDRAVSFNLADEDGQLIIWQYAEDPDAWRYLEFAKSGPAV